MLNVIPIEAAQRLAAEAFAPLRGSEEMFTGMAWGSFSALCCNSLLHRAAVSASSTAVIRIWRMCRCSRNACC